MSNSEKKSLGCAVCNPALQRPYEEIVGERRAEFAADMHVIRMADGRYHVVSIPGFDGEPIHAWPGPWDTEAAARLFMNDLLNACAEGSPSDAYCSSGIFEHFNLAGRILDVIEKHGGDSRRLSLVLASERPWESAKADPSDGEIAF